MTIISAILNCPYPKAVHLYKIRIILLDWFWRRCHLKNSFFFLNLILPWQPNKIAIGHKKYKLGKHSSNDHNCQTWFTSLHVFGENAINLTIFPIKVYGSFLLPWQSNQEADHQKIWLFSKDPNQATFFSSKVQIASMALEELSF